MEKLYTLKETLTLLRVSRTTLYRLMADKTLKPLKLRGKLLFTERSLDKFIKGLQK